MLAFVKLMSIRIAITIVNGSPVLVALVDSAFTLPAACDALMARIQPHHPTMPILLVSIEDNGFRAHAAFRTGEILALLQLEQLAFTDLDLDKPLPEKQLPF